MVLYSSRISELAGVKSKFNTTKESLKAAKAKEREAAKELRVKEKEDDQQRKRQLREVKAEEKKENDAITEAIKSRPSQRLAAGSLKSTPTKKRKNLDAVWGQDDTASPQTTVSTAKKVKKTAALYIASERLLHTRPPNRTLENQLVENVTVGSHLMG